MRYLFCIFLLLTPAARLISEEDLLAGLRPGHPRLFVTKDSFVAMLQAAKTDPVRAKLHRQIIASAEAQMREEPIQHVLVGPRMLEQSRKAFGHIVTCAVAYRLTGEARFLNHARTTMLTAAAFPDWNPSHFLDVAEMAAGVGLGYDWLYDDLTPADRATIRQALIDKALVFAKPAYARAYPDRESFPFVKGNLTNNWNQVCNGGFVIAALAIAEDQPDLARQVIAGLRETLPAAMQAYEPDGAYPEGPGYWGYGTRYNMMILAGLESALGRDFGLGDKPGFSRTALYRVQVQSPTGLSFNYADGNPQMGSDSSLTWLGMHYGEPAATAKSRSLLLPELARPPNPGDRFFATQAIWFPPAEIAAKPLPLDAKFEGPSKLAIFRSAWGDPGALWTGLKAGSNRVNHGHLDLGSFMFDSDGERWAVDLGPDDYDLPGYWDKATAAGKRWQFYRLNNRSHNTLTPGDVLQSPDADAPFISFGPSSSRAFVVTDLTSAYASEAARFTRGLALLDRTRVLVQDDVKDLRRGRPLAWQMLTGARVALDGRRATLTQNGKTLRVEILAPTAVHFEMKPARPPTGVENQNDGITSLYVTLPATPDRETDIRVAVLLTPVGDRWPERPAPLLVPLTEWK